MYVWFDALTNYVSTLGWPDESGNFKTFWQEAERIQMAGKDQLRFQSILFQAMLMSAGVVNTERIFYHGFITSGGKKMSKSVGNVIDPIELVDKYGTDALRYYLLRHIHPTDDSDLTREKFHESYTAHLVNGVGNLTNRILNMADSYGVEVDVMEIWNTTDVSEELANHLKDFNFHLAMDSIWEVVAELDKSIDEEKPFIVAKEDKEKAAALVAAYLPKLIWIAKALRSFMPETADAMWAAIQAMKKPEKPLFGRVDPI